MILLAALLLVQGAYDPAAARVYGVGRESCKLLLSPETEARARDWVLAAWSGKNGEFGHVGDSLGERGILAEVVKQCGDRSFVTIALATDRAFKAAAAAKR